MDDLPTDYDVIVVGTGMTESVIAAALSRIGKSVLHIDPNEYYGNNWASFNLEGFDGWAKKFDNNKNTEPLNEKENNPLNDSETVININKTPNVWNLEQKFCSQENKNIDDEKEIITESDNKVEIVKDEVDLSNHKKSKAKLVEEIKKLGRRFNLDLCPKLLFSKGVLVQLLISSNIARYAEFKSVTRVLTWRENQLEPVPCSRADVFSTKNVSVVQKRILVKILTLFANYAENLDEFQGFENKTFLDYLKHKKLPENLIHYILYAIAMGDNTTPCLNGVKACKAFLESLGRYGNTPFIFPMYGCGELPQCFCRLCAVFGGIYCLQRGIEGLRIKDNKCVGVISDKQLLNAETVILSYSHAPESFLLNKDTEKISRGIFITDRSILNSDKECLTLLQFPPIPKISENSVTVIELGSGCCTSPENFFVVHMTTKMTSKASSDLKHVIDFLFATDEDDSDSKDSKPRILWSSTWNVAKGTSQTSSSCVENVKVCSSVDSELDYDFSINEAKKIFKELYPDEEFLPRAPDPDEIVLDIDENAGGDSAIKQQDSQKPSKDNSENSEEGQEKIDSMKDETLSQDEKKEKTENSSGDATVETNFLEKSSENSTNEDKNLGKQFCDNNKPNEENICSSQS